MQYYHTTAIENKESVKENGINAMITDKITLSEDQIDEEGVFLFNEIDIAHEFGVDNYAGEYTIAVVVVEENAELIVDPEYDGEAVFHFGEIKINQIVDFIK